MMIRIVNSPLSVGETGKLIYFAVMKNQGTVTVHLKKCVVDNILVFFVRKRSNFFIKYCSHTFQIRN